MYGNMVLVCRALSEISAMALSVQHDVNMDGVLHAVQFEWGKATLAWLALRGSKKIARLS